MVSRHGSYIFIHAFKSFILHIYLHAITRISCTLDVEGRRPSTRSHRWRTCKQPVHWSFSLHLIFVASCELLCRTRVSVNRQMSFIHCDKSMKLPNSSDYFGSGETVSQHFWCCSDFFLFLQKEMDCSLEFFPSKTQTLTVPVYIIWPVYGRLRLSFAVAL